MIPGNIKGSRRFENCFSPQFGRFADLIGRSFFAEVGAEAGARLNVLTLSQ